jgi:hypothetical protein
MFDLSNIKIDVECPSCKRKHTPTINDVMNKKIIHCSCSTNIQLTDNNGSVKKGVNDVNSSFKKLNDAFKNLGR